MDTHFLSTHPNASVCSLWDFNVCISVETAAYYIDIADSYIIVYVPSNFTITFYNLSF